MDPAVLEVMRPFFLEDFGNASSRQHSYGFVAAQAVDKAREQVAALIGASDPKEIIFTSSATEANNLALKGITAAVESRRVVSVVTEHTSVLEPLRGLETTLLPVDGEGFVDPAAVRAALTDDTALVAVMLVNNEIGTVQPIAAISNECRARDVFLVCDAVAALGRVPINVRELGVDALSLSAHKIHGPKGVGALWLRRSKPRVPLIAQIEGGGHERGFRAGTLNVPGIVGFGEAARLAQAGFAEETKRLRGLRDRLYERIAAELDGITLNGPALSQRAPHNLNLSVSGVDGEALIMDLRNVAVSSGSACASASLEASHVLRAIGRSDELAHAALRFGLGRFTTETEIDYAADETVNAVRGLRSKRC